MWGIDPLLIFARVPGADTTVSTTRPAGTTVVYWLRISCRRNGWRGLDCRSH